MPGIPGLPVEALTSDTKQMTIERKKEEKKEGKINCREERERNKREETKILI